MSAKVSIPLEGEARTPAANAVEVKAHQRGISEACRATVHSTLSCYTENDLLRLRTFKVNVSKPIYLFACTNHLLTPISKFMGLIMKGIVGGRDPCLIIKQDWGIKRNGLAADNFGSRASKLREELKGKGN